MTVIQVAMVSLLGADGELRKFSEIETDIINYAMRLYGGNVSEVARRLQIGRSTLCRRLERYEDVKRRSEGGDVLIDIGYRSAA